MKRTPLAIGLLATALVLTACTAPTTESTAATEEQPGYLAVADPSLATGGDLSVQLDYDSVEANGLDPQTATTARSWTLMGLVYDTLVTVGPDFSIEPGLATSWDTPSDTEYVFTLRDDAVFSNGRPMTADDVVGSLQRLLDSKSDWSLQLGQVSSVQATGGNEVTVTLAAPYTSFLGALANTPAAILPMTEIADGSVDITTTMLGTGPYVVQDHVQDQSWTFGPNEHYYGAATRGPESVAVDIVTEENTRLAAIRDGSADYAFFNNVDALDLLGGTENARVVNQQNTDFYYLIINSQNPDSPLADQKVRFAINSALDRQEISDIALAGQALPTGVTPATLPGACPAADLPSEKPTTDEIKQALADAGAEDLDLTITLYNTEPALAQIAQVMQQELAAVGVNLTIENLDIGSFVDKIYSSSPSDIDLALSWYAGYGDAAMVSKWWNGDVSTFTAGFKANDPAQNALQVAAGSEPAGAERDATMVELCASVDESSELVPLVTRPGVIGYRTDSLSPTINTNEGYGSVLRDIVDYRMIDAG
ncbi:ABC transporter substrate-binding protein [Herbiconiux sp.]|uniref:ABC transporter substrate-binding protein n=1 Tax=Herbiconiux sp. TaxID=1871186 RepID=UPI0025BC5260|nr:ABC transporter substrate-binding protein [Herbiconiux sp.]